MMIILIIYISELIVSARDFELLLKTYTLSYITLHQSILINIGESLKFHIGDQSARFMIYR